jgi:hypothetical protein
VWMDLAALLRFRSRARLMRTPPGPRMERRINRFAAHASSNRLPEQAVRAFNSVRRFTARYYTPRMSHYLRYGQPIFEWQL